MILKSVQFALIGLLCFLCRQCLAWLPAREGGKIRGVNLGGLFVIEPWMMTSEWKGIGCGKHGAERECVSALGQEAADSAFNRHWRDWISENDFEEMAEYGINTVRIPVGYWIKEDLVYSNETFPRGALQYLKRVVGWASKYNIYTIIDLHGGPGAQVKRTSSTGQQANNVEFYTTANYERAYSFFEWITRIIHTDTSYSSVGAIELINEPIQGEWAITGTLISEFYPQAWRHIRSVEDELAIRNSSRLHIMMMNTAWGAGDPITGLQSTYNTSFALLDDHRFTKFDPNIAKTRIAYMEDACRPTRRTAADLNIPLVTGEWSISPADSVQANNEFTNRNKEWYSRWFAAQMQQYERQSNGWIFWTWKISLNDYRWGYQAAVRAGVIPRNLTLAREAKPCEGDLTEGLAISGSSVVSAVLSFKTTILMFIFAAFL